MFKLAAFTDEISQDLERACTVLNEFDAAGVEIRGVWDIPCHKLTDAQVEEIKRIVENHGLEVASIGSPFGKCELEDAAAVAEHMEILRRCADIGHALGCTLVRGFAFWGHGVRQKPWDRMLDAYEPVPAVLEEKQVILGLENEAACLVGTAGHTRTFLDLLECDRVKALWDPANHVQDPDSDDEPVFPNGYEALRKDLVHVHAKDAVVGADGRRPNVFLGEGICRWREQLQALKDSDYKGHVSLETHVDPERFPESLRDTYGHYLSGEGREGASKVCLAWLRDAMAALS